MSYDPKTFFSKNPEENWQNAVNRLWKTFEQCENTNEFVHTYIIVRDCMYDYLGKLNYSRHSIEIMELVMSGGSDINTEFERYGQLGWKTAFGDIRFQLLARKHQVSDAEYQRVKRKYEESEKTAKIGNCTYCNFGIPIMQDFEIKICPFCGKIWDYI